MLKDIFFFIRQITEVSNRMLNLIEDQNMDRFDAWNNSSVFLVETAKVNLFSIANFIEIQSKLRFISICLLFICF